MQISRLPRYLSGQKEYEVELQFSSGLLSYPDRVVNSEESVDGEKIPDFQDHHASAPGLLTYGMDLYRIYLQFSSNVM